MFKRIVKMKTVKDESLGLVSVSRLKVPRLSVSYKILQLVSSRMKNFEIVSSRSCLVCFHFTQSHLGLVLKLSKKLCQKVRSFQRNNAKNLIYFFIKSRFSSRFRKERHRDSRSRLGLANIWYIYGYICLK